MPRLVISTVGTSILTNQINMRYESDWSDLLEARANDKELDGEDILEAMEELTRRAKEKLYTDLEQKLINDDIDEIRNASAELNGIYGLYGEDLEQGKFDEHLLVTTDTKQGRIAAQLVKEFLDKQGLPKTKIYIPSELSTATTNSFTQGIAKLITELDKKIIAVQSKTICFNLVGGFKALQGYMNTIGMFYADEIIYIFEGKNQQLIKIQRLPIKVDITEVEPYKVQLAIMDVELMPEAWEFAKNVPQDWVLVIDKELFLSAWGQIIWNKCKHEILTQDNLLNFSKLKVDYQQSFKDDYKKVKNPKDRIKLQEKIASISGILCKHRDGISALRDDGGIKLRRYKNTEIDHFNVSDSLRVSCKVIDGGRLSLRYYGTHDHVERSEGIR
jgi:putative CRISPR-associated protein (TIGR02619 family)